MGEERAKKVFDHKRAGNGGFKYNCKTNNGLRCFSQRAEEPRLEGQKAACVLRAALCPALM